MDINRLANKIKQHSHFPKVGMIASHLGVVRGNSLNGRAVSAIEVKFDQSRLDAIITEIKNLPGIIEVLVEVSEGRLKVGDEIMHVVIGGDTREHVFPALIDAVDRIKIEATRKKELFL